MGLRPGLYEALTRLSAPPFVSTPVYEALTTQNYPNYRETAGSPRTGYQLEAGKTEGNDRKALGARARAIAL